MFFYKNLIVSALVLIKFRQFRFKFYIPLKRNFISNLALGLAEISSQIYGANSLNLNIRKPDDL
ncbi:hypothetical protein [uncultured Campylobacter sp.]|uniref:hypothetical protein n=1 Tax=uncultured Campylobacter sp. TaxID=218934 RepID=UPI002636DCFD|nr:hypothetical protein [uncultured Campylobacter sp.]